MIEHPKLRGRLLFLKTPFAIIDGVIILISIVFVIYGLAGEALTTTALRSLRFLQFLRFIRVDKRGGAWRTVIRVIKENSGELMTAYYFAFLINFICI